MTRALEAVGWSFAGSLGRNDDVRHAGVDVDLVIVAVPDHSIATVAEQIGSCDAVIMHLAGSRPLSDLQPHTLVASLHPLVSLPDAETGARRLLAGAVFAVAGAPLAAAIVEQLGGQAVRVEDDQRSLYHATAAIASNHLVSLCAQVERLADAVGIPPGAYWQLMSATLDNVIRLGPAAALTGPAARSDWATIAAHLAALPAEELELYEVLSRGAAELAGHPWQNAPSSPSDAAASNDEGRP
ncbi:MAG: DUF2520 domain-containing protein [Acidimicrobiales bacterium]